MKQKQYKKENTTSYLIETWGEENYTLLKEKITTRLPSTVRGVLVRHVAAFITEWLHQSVYIPSFDRSDIENFFKNYNINVDGNVIKISSK